MPLQNGIILFSAQPAMLWSENDLLNYLFKSFASMQDAYHTGKISRDKYLNGNCNGSMIRLCRFLLQQKKLKIY